MGLGGRAAVSHARDAGARPRVFAARDSGAEAHEGQSRLLISARLFPGLEGKLRASVPLARNISLRVSPVFACERHR